MHDDLIYTITGCAFTVFNQLGNVWQEDVYEQALEAELIANGLHARRQVEYEVYYFDKNVGTYRLDLLVEDTVVLELKARPELTPLHQAQLISYLKGFDKPIGQLLNFGATSLERRIIPNKLDQKTPLFDNFDFDKVNLPHKERIEDLLYMANRILVHLGAGYFHQVYRRAFYVELKQAGVDFRTIKSIEATYRHKRLGEKDVYFFIIGDLLLSTIAVKALTPLVTSRFYNYIRHLGCRHGLIVNFNNIHLDFKYYERERHEC